VPAAVIKSARVYLRALEQQSLGTTGPQQQFDLGFSAETVAEKSSDELRDALAELKPDEMSPREALAALYKLKDQCGNAE